MILSIIKNTGFQSIREQFISRLKSFVDADALPAPAAPHAAGRGRGAIRGGRGKGAGAGRGTHADLVAARVAIGLDGPPSGNFLSGDAPTVPQNQAILREALSKAHIKMGNIGGDIGSGRVEALFERSCIRSLWFSYRPDVLARFHFSIMCVVEASMQSPPHYCWSDWKIVFSDSGLHASTAKLIFSQCSCRAGVVGVCSHSHAVLFTLCNNNTQVRIQS